MSAIVIEIGEDYYAMLGISREELAPLTDSEIKKKIRPASKEMTRALKKQADRGDTAAEAQAARINEGADILMDQEKRANYERANPGLALYSIQSIIPPYYDPANRSARLRFVNALMAEEGVKGTLRCFMELDRTDFTEDFGPDR